MNDICNVRYFFNRTYSFLIQEKIFNKNAIIQFYKNNATNTEQNKTTACILFDLKQSFDIIITSRSVQNLLIKIYVFSE